MIRLLLVFVFIVVPLVELAIIIQVGELIGVWWTVALLLVDSLLGAWLVRREGVRAWRRFRAALGEARVPADEVLEGALVLFGGALLLTPGFATDALGLALMVPSARALVAALLKRQLGSRFVTATLGGGGHGGPGGRRPGGSRFGAPGAGPASRRADDVVDVEVISVERAPDPSAGNGDINSRGGG